jgi:hypothetical protein
VFLRTYPAEEIPEVERRVAPILALGIVAMVGVGIACFWLAYRLSGEA